MIAAKIKSEPRFAPTNHRTEECVVGVSVFMVLERVSNTMDRFMLTNMHEVLQEVDFFNLIKEK
ncbi:MAG: hypothetical protein KKC79_04405 [Gammaproteobacteria bacterium]|nr:hypothetical protein [Gammaproteobacteria bacterium]MBU2287813.1 hypothetical protein [Gammaproteobacteria bacterium]MBU2407874.1 hypothetical protein [Gammaproteobacteria bacterium]